jgi:putative oxidoreductase
MKRLIHPLLCWMLSGILVWSGAVKALNPAAFAEAIMGFNLVAWPIAVGLSHYLPWLELIVAVALLIPRLRSGGVLVAAMLFTGFSVVLAITWWRGFDVNCGCFGSSGQTAIHWVFMRATLLSAISWYCGLRSQHGIA